MRLQYGVDLRVCWRRRHLNGAKKDQKREHKRKKSFAWSDNSSAGPAWSPSVVAEPGLGEFHDETRFGSPW